MRAEMGWGGKEIEDRLFYGGLERDQISRMLIYANKARITKKNLEANANRSQIRIHPNRAQNLF